MYLMLRSCFTGCATLVYDVYCRLELMSTVERTSTTPAGLPPGWRREVVVRKSGQSAGKYDVYYFRYAILSQCTNMLEMFASYCSPDGKKFRSKPQIVRYLGESVDLNLFDFSGRSTVGGQRRSAKDRPPKKEMHLGRFQERPLSSTPMRPAGPIRRTCGVIKLPVMYYPLRPATSAVQLVTSSDPQVVLGSVVQQLWVRRLSSLHPIDSVSGEMINPDSPPAPLENIAVPVLSEQQNSHTVQSTNLSQSSVPSKLPTGINSVKSPPINAQYNNVQNTNLRMTTAATQPPSLPNHYTTNAVHDNTAVLPAGVIKSNNSTTTTLQTTTNNNTILPVHTGPSLQPVTATGTPPQGFIPIQQNGQGLLLQPNNVVYMQLPQQGAGKGSSNFTTGKTTAATALQMVQQLPQTVPQQGLNHSFITETEIRLQEQKVKLLRQQLGLTS